MTIYDDPRSKTSELLRLRREKHMDRRKRQLDRFFRSVASENADKMIFLFDPDMNIA